jgi:hypothetical protein
MYLHINSEYLQLAGPLMAKYFGFHPSMLHDEIIQCVESSGIDYRKIENGILNTNHDETFRENKNLTFIAEVPYNKSIEETFSTYFDFLDNDSAEEETITCNSKDLI